MTNNITVGSRVRVHDRELPHLSNSGYRGKEGVVTDTYGQREFRVEFDDPTLDSNGSWTTMGIELVPEAPFKTGDRAVITDRHNAPHGLGCGFRSGTAVTVGDVTPSECAEGGYLAMITNDDGKTYKSFRGVSVNWLDPAPAEDDEIRVGDVVQVSDRHGSLVADQWANPGHLFTVTAVRKDVDGNPLISARDLDGGRTIRDYGLSWFDKVPAASAAASASAAGSNLRQENAQLRELVEDWRSGFDKLNKELDGQIEKTRAVEAERDKLLGKLRYARKGRESYAAALTYALELLSPEQVQRVLGYQDGVS